MPNCDYFALGSDFAQVLDFIFGESECRVFEAYSPFNEELVEFRATSEVIERYGSEMSPQGNGGVLLQLLAPGSGEVVIERLGTDAERFRYAASGWGMIQMQFGHVAKGRLFNSHTSHNTLKRALLWEPHNRSRLGAALAWNWPQVAKTSGRINRFIRKIAVSKIGARPVLPEAARQISAGINAV